MAVQFIAEVSSNHNRDLYRCLALIDIAADIGCNGVKFQLFKVDKLFAPEILAKSPEHRERINWELPVEYLPTLASHCRERGILFGCTPFYLDAVEQLLPYVDFFKVASYELMWSDLLSMAARTSKPVILSTGMATMAEVQEAFGMLRREGCRDLTLLHCVSGYPCPPEECNLAAIETLRQSMDCPVGWSDHSVSPGVVFRAIHRWDASVVEFHLDLEGKGLEFGGGHCWLPEGIGSVIKAVRSGVAADGNGGKEPVPSEMADRQWRADPIDGLRPLKLVRDEWRG